MREDMSVKGQQLNGCPKCNGNIINDGNEIYCLQCSKRDFDAPPQIPDAVALKREAGRKGGKARMAKLKPEQRSEIARKGAEAKWNKQTDIDDCREILAKLMQGELDALEKRLQITDENEPWGTYVDFQGNLSKLLNSWAVRMSTIEAGRAWPRGVSHAFTTLGQFLKTAEEMTSKAQNDWEEIDNG